MKHRQGPRSANRHTIIMLSGSTLFIRCSLCNHYTNYFLQSDRAYVLRDFTSIQWYFPLKQHHYFEIKLLISHLLFSYNISIYLCRPLLYTNMSQTGDGRVL